MRLLSFVTSLGGVQHRRVALQEHKSVEKTALYAATVPLQALALSEDKAAHFVFFLAFATLTVQLGATLEPAKELRGPELTAGQALLAPAFSSTLLLGLYYLITAWHVDVTFAYKIACCALALGAGGVIIGPQAMAAGSIPIVHYLVASDHASTVGVLEQNAIAWSLAMVAASIVRVSSFATAALFLGGLFCYDAWFVFGTDVMMTVAKTVDAPVKFIARNPPTAAFPFALLGLGDVAIPAILVRLMYEFDQTQDDKGYGAATVVAYAAGLGASFYANEFVRAGQPALVYLVPATLGAALLTAASRGTLDELLAFRPYADDKNPTG